MLIGSTLQSIAESHIRIQWIIARTYFLMTNRVVNGCRHLGFVGEEFTKLKLGCNRILFLRIGGTLSNTLLESTETITDVSARKVY